MAASRYEFASQSDGLGFRGVLVRENASLTEELTAELAGILSWVVGRVGPADPSGEGTEPKSSTETILACYRIRLPGCCVRTRLLQIGIGHEIPIADLLGDWRL